MYCNIASGFDAALVIAPMFWLLYFLDTTGLTRFGKILTALATKNGSL